MNSARLFQFKDALLRGLAWVFPSPLVAALAASAAIAEAVLLANVPEPVYHGGWTTTCVAAVFLGWFWITSAWLIHWVAGWCESIQRPAGRRMAFAAATLGLALGALVYIASWGLYFQTGRFMNLEAVHFLVVNFGNLWTYVLEAEPRHLVLLAVFTLVLFGGLPWLLARAGHSTWEPAHRPAVGVSRLRSWNLATIALLGAMTLVTWDNSLQRRTMRIDALTRSLNPVVSLTASGIEAWTIEPIVACLDDDELEPLAAADVWQLDLAGEKDPPSIIIVAIESLRHDVVHQVHQGREITPNLNRLAKGGIQFTRAYAQSTHSDYADVCIVSSLYPLRSRSHHYYRSSDPWPKTRLYDLLQPAGYQTAIISSQNEVWGGMDAFLDSPRLDYFYHPQRSDAPSQVSVRDPGFAAEVRAGALICGKFADRHTTEVALDWITRQHEQKRPFFLNMTFQSSHFPYELPEGTAQPFQPCQLDSDVFFMQYPKEKAPQVRNAYYNAVHECDRQLGRLVARLRELGMLDNTILLVTGENGEAFHENGSVGHAREPVEPAIHIAWVLHAPGRVAPRVDDYPVEHVDVAPTLLGLLGAARHPNQQGIDVLSPDRPPGDERLMFFHVLSPAARADAVLLGGRWKYMQSYDTHNQWLFDVVADPGETDNLIEQRTDLAAPLREVLNSWRQRQLAYYYFPAYYRKYFPPRPPRWQPGVLATSP